MKTYKFQQVDVFTNQPLHGNPLAVVHGADKWTVKQMQSFAHWTNLSETTFIMDPSHPDADYKVRIFTPENELPFAGHPTLGTCHSWLSLGGLARDDDVIKQECGIGLIYIKREADRLAFRAPPLSKTGPLNERDLTRLSAAFGLKKTDVVAHQWVANGPNWSVIMLNSAQKVLELTPDLRALSGDMVGVVGPYPDGGECDLEVRGFAVPAGINEDPVTGSLNAGLAMWLIHSGMMKDRYVVSQGTILGRRGRVYVEKRYNDIWVGGDVIICVDGQVRY
ncbi:MAG: phenazine biosynthesis protein PhzF [Rhodospirillaceae bacterium TMED8]|nr:phenazine biosynthesis protein PhzF [Magnetovibrio sp.]OUT47852.1 MAG: phenazine biosynthesis protein PhzF [Rhodospirillaceae bacterium TMED8]